MSIKKPPLLANFILTALLLTGSTTHLSANWLDAITGQNKKFVARCLDPEQDGLTQKRLLKACRKVTKINSVSYSLHIQSHFIVGKILYQTGKKNAARFFLDYVSKADCDYKSACLQACQALSILEQHGATVAACSIYMREYGQNDIALYNRGVSYYRVDGYKAAIRDLSNISSQNSAFLVYSSLLKLGYENKAKSYQQSNKFLKNQNNSSSRQVVNLAKKEAKNEPSAVIAYCSKNGAIGTATNKLGHQAGRKAYKDCLSKEFTPSNTECCKIAATTTSDICVSIARNKNGKVFSAEGAKSSSAAKNAKSRCSNSSCKVLATKCSTDQ